MSLGEGLTPALGDPGGGATDNNEVDPFAQRAKVLRSPDSNQTTGTNTGGNSARPSYEQEDNLGFGLNGLFTPKTSSKNAQAEQQVVHIGKMADVKKKVDELYEFIKDKHNVHHRIRALVTGIRGSMQAVDRQHQAYKVRAEKAEKELMKLKVMTAPVMGTPVSRTAKRDRDTPEEEEKSKKQKEDNEEVRETVGEHSNWRTVENKNAKKTEKKKKEVLKAVEKKKEEKKSEKPRPRPERKKGEALITLCYKFDFFERTSEPT